MTDWNAHYPGDAASVRRGCVALVRANREMSAAALLLLLALVFVFAIVPSAKAAPGGGWTLSEFSAPTVLAAGDSGNDFLVLNATNTGGRATDGSPIVSKATLPEGLTVDPAGISTNDSIAQFASSSGGSFSCQKAPPECTFSGVVIPGETLTVTIPVDVAANVTSTTVTEGGLVS